MGHYLRWVTGPLLLIATYLATLVALDTMEAPLLPTYRHLGPVSATTVLGVAGVWSCGLIALMTLERRNSVVRLAVFVALCGGSFAGLGSLRDRPAVRFWGAYRAIQIGMTAAEVDGVMARHYPGRPPPGAWATDSRFPGEPYYHVELDYPPRIMGESFTVKLGSGRVVDKLILYDCQIFSPF